MAGIIQQPTVRIDGREWFLFTIDYDTADGKFATYIYALSLDHAQMMLDELKQTGRVGGQVIDVQT